MSAWHELSEKSQRVARRRYFPGWFFNGLAWLFRRMGSASPRPTAKEYLAPMRMSVSPLASYHHKRDSNCRQRCVCRCATGAASL